MTLEAIPLFLILPYLDDASLDSVAATSTTMAHPTIPEIVTRFIPHLDSSFDGREVIPLLKERHPPVRHVQLIRQRLVYALQSLVREETLESFQKIKTPAILSSIFEITVLYNRALRASSVRLEDADVLLREVVPKFLFYGEIDLLYDIAQSVEEPELRKRVFRSIFDRRCFSSWVSPKLEELEFATQMAVEMKDNIILYQAITCFAEARREDHLDRAMELAITLEEPSLQEQALLKISFEAFRKNRIDLCIDVLGRVMNGSLKDRHLYGLSDMAMERAESDITPEAAKAMIVTAETFAQLIQADDLKNKALSFVAKHLSLP